MLIFCSNLGFILTELQRSNKKSSLKNFVHFPRIPCIKSCKLNDFMSILPHFPFKLDFVKFCNSNIEDFENLFDILTRDKMPGFIEKNKVPFNSVNNLVVNRHFLLDL